MHRSIVEPLLVARPCQAPFASPRAGKGARGEGIRYERSLARALPGAKHGQWFEFQDRNGLGKCQPDFLLDHGQFVVVLECKYTWVPEGHSQIDLLYRPIVERLLGKPVRGIVVCKRLVPEVLRPGGPRIAGSYKEAVDLAAAVDNKVVWHWLGT